MTSGLGMFIYYTILPITENQGEPSAMCFHSKYYTQSYAYLEKMLYNYFSHICEAKIF